MDRKRNLCGICFSVRTYNCLMRYFTFTRDIKLQDITIDLLLDIYNQQNFYEIRNMGVGCKNEFNNAIEAYLKEHPNNSHNDEYEGVSKFWGARMPMMAMEELAECIQAISKCERKKTYDGFDAFNHLAEEIGDVYISLNALTWHYKEICPDLETKIQERINSKLSKKY